jgi:putative ABC transport system ATP-binding protein
MRDRVRSLLSLLRELCTEMNKTIIMVTHDPRAAQRTDRTMFLDKGQLVKDSPQAMLH